MKIFAAKEAKDSFGLLLDTARQEPVTIEKKGRPVAVILSIEEFQRLEAMEEAWWAGETDKAKIRGFIGEEETAELFRKILNGEKDQPK